MPIQDVYMKCIILLTILYRVKYNSVVAVCQLSVPHGNNIYNFSLTSPLSNYPHGVLSEDGFYKVAANGTVLWFQLCDGMVFNHDPPRCLDCQDCGGSSHCGMGCSALIANQLGGYYVCTTIGRSSNTNINLIDEKNPSMGVTVRMSSGSRLTNCSLSVSVLCDSNGLQGPNSLDKLGMCEYSTVLRHPSGCAKTISRHGRGWGWFSTLLIILLCLFAGYLVGGAVYRYFHLGIRGVHVIPNLEVWLTLPHRVQGLFRSLIRRFRRPTEGHRSSYSPVNF
ncbi:autophagy-like protein [Thalictrum thalictroides]|uniref:Autophagy-like protein n=1 Tax=Thalictrum thalictroides TaxID=46969 RepID=A0A7J6WUE9_THATH|nr:autophagy-like protein [Thalictrum thalictroides]